MYPWVDGVPAMELGLTDRQWVAHGRFVAALHRTGPPADLAAMVARESFVPWGAGRVRALGPRTERAGHGHPLRRQLAGLWRAHRDQITVAADRAERLGRVVAASRPRLVLCHADLHTANLLVGRLGEATRRQAVAELRGLFAPGDVVEAARRADRGLEVSRGRGRRGGRPAGGGAGSRRPPPGRPCG